MKLTRYNGNFVSCKEQIGKAGQRIATAREGMGDRIALGFDSHYKTQGCWHTEGTARIGGINYWCMPKFAPTTNYQEETLESDKGNRYLDLTDKTIISSSGKPFIELIPEIAEKDKNLPPYKRRVLIPEIQETFSHDTSSLNKVDIALFLARNKNLAKRYGDFLNEKCGISSTTFFQIGNNYDDVGAGFWLYWLEHGFDSDFGGNWDLDYGDGSLFGVAKREALSQGKNLAEPTQKILAYKPSDLKVLQSVRTGDLAPKALERIIQRFL